MFQGKSPLAIVGAIQTKEEGTLHFPPLTIICAVVINPSAERPAGIAIAAILLEHLGELLSAHARDPGELCDLGSTVRHLVRDLNERLRDRRTTGLGLDTHRCHRCGEAQHLALAQADDLTGLGDTQGEIGDLGLCRGEVIAQIDDRGAQVVRLISRGAHDVRDPREGESRLLGAHVGRDAHLGDRLGELRNVLSLNAQLTGDLADVRQLRGGGRDRVTHLDELVLHR